MTSYMPPELYADVYGKYIPRVCVDAVVVRSEEVLMTRRAIEPELGKWHLPGGKIVRGETIDEALKRHVLHDLGVGCRVFDLLGVSEFLDQHAVVGDYTFTMHSIMICKKVELQRYDIRLNREEASEWQWFNCLPKDIDLVQDRFLRSHLLWLK